MFSANVFTTFSRLLKKPQTNIAECVRNASKKTGGSTQNTSSKVRPKHRGWKKQDGHHVQSGTILALQRGKLRFHPGLNTGFAYNGTIWAFEAGRVAITCEKIDPNWDRPWVQRIYAGRENQVIYKKYFNIIADPQHTRFKLIDEI